MFGPWIEIGSWIKKQLPRKGWHPRDMAFIHIHYIYITSLAILGSILLYPAGGIPYIDALFFASGAATQSGLNTVDVNNILLYQQLVLYLMTMIANPIFIHSFVVFIRLYWFEKRFQKVVKDAKQLRRTISKRKSQMREDPNFDREEKGVRGRSIVVLRSGLPSHPSPIMEAEKSAEQDSESNTPTNSGTSNEDGPNKPKLKDPAQRDIKFADDLIRTESPEEVRLPTERSAEQHIAFLEKQRNTKDDEILRIPGPRDYERGYVPHALDEEEEDGGRLMRRVTTKTEPNTRENSGDRNRDIFHRRNITIDDSNRPSNVRERSNSVPNSAFRRRGPNQLGSLPEVPTDSQFSNFRNRVRTTTFNKILTANSANVGPSPYLSWEPTIGRNSAFIDLNEEQREELGGIEYRSLKTLAAILIVYFVGFHLLGVVCLVPWILKSQTYGSQVDAVSQNRTWWGFFTAASLFNDLGYTLTPTSMIIFQDAIFPLLIGSFLIVIGNTGFPCMLRFCIWFTSLFVPSDSSLWEELRFLLDHPRRCFTLLFPSKATWWLFWILVVLNGLDLILFIVLDLNSAAVTTLPLGIRFLDGWFQAVSTRTAGFAVVNLADLHPGIQVSYLIMMYISAFPIAISMRRTNVYEEQSLGIYASNDDEEEDEPSYVGAHVRKQLSFDLWYIFLGLFIIAIVEGNRIENSTEYAFTTFSILFEIVSAYGTVGLSLGYPTINASFSAEFHTLSKLIIIAMQIRGRHRGLPYGLDRAILLPSESLHQKDVETTVREIRRRNSVASRRGSMASQMSGATGFQPHVSGNNFLQLTSAGMFGGGAPRHMSESAVSSSEGFRDARSRRLSSSGSRVGGEDA